MVYKTAAVKMVDAENGLQNCCCKNGFLLEKLAKRENKGADGVYKVKENKEEERGIEKMVRHQNIA